MYTKEQIAEKLEQDNRWLVRGLLALYKRQTADELENATTSHRNGMGFNAYDANLLTGFARQIQAWQDTPEDERRYANPLSTIQYRVLRQKMMRYAGQLTRIANGE